MSKKYPPLWLATSGDSANQTSVSAPLAGERENGLVRAMPKLISCRFDNSVVAVCTVGSQDVQNGSRVRSFDAYCPVNSIITGKFQLELFIPVIFWFLRSKTMAGPHNLESDHLTEAGPAGRGSPNRAAATGGPGGFQVTQLRGRRCVVADLGVDGLPVGGGVELSEYGTGADR